MNRSAENLIVSEDKDNVMFCEAHSTSKENILFCTQPAKDHKN